MRNVGAEAAAQLAALHARAFDKPWSEAEIARLLENPTAYAILSQHEDGFILAWAPGAQAEILTLAVAPEARRRGVGAGLTAAAMAAALARGAGEMILDVAEDNAPARALYQRLGFTELHRRRGYYARENGAADALILRRPLPRPMV